MKKVLKNKFLLLIILISILAILVAVYYGGEYRLSGLKLLKTGRIEVQLDNVDTGIFIDDVRVGFSTEKNESLTFKKIKPGTHSILAAKNKNWPWTKDVEVKEGETVKVHPFVIPITKPDVVRINKESKEYSEAKKLINSFLFSSKTKEATSTDGSTKIWVEENKILGEKTENPKEKFLIFESIKDPIKNISFYKDRNDVIIFASGGFIYAIETHKKGGQNFQPIIQGEDPVFITKDFDSIYILDNDIILLLKL